MKVSHDAVVPPLIPDHEHVLTWSVRFVNWNTGYWSQETKYSMAQIFIGQPQ